MAGEHFLAESMSNRDLAIYVLAGMSILYIVFVRPMMMRRRDPLARSPRIGLSQQREIEKQMSDLLVELSEMARQITAQLDTRSRKLQVLMDEADKRIAALEAGAQDAGPRMRLVEPTEAERPAQIGPPDPPALKIDPRHAEIYALADQGRAPQEIAQAIGRPRGEVELILALRSTHHGDTETRR
jgi:hypothetical protein